MHLLISLPSNILIHTHLLSTKSTGACLLHTLHHWVLHAALDWSHFQVLLRWLCEVKCSQTILVSQCLACSILNQVLHYQKVAMLSCNMKRRVLIELCLLIHVLALSDQYPDLVQFAISACSPNIYSQYYLFQNIRLKPSLVSGFLLIWIAILF
jgi:hypothetical protein